MTLEEIVDKAASMPPEEGIHGEISNFCWNGAY